MWTILGELTVATQIVSPAESWWRDFLEKYDMS